MSYLTMGLAVLLTVAALGLLSFTLRRHVSAAGRSRSPRAGRNRSRGRGRTPARRRSPKRARTRSAARNLRRAPSRGGASSAFPAWKIGAAAGALAAVIVAGNVTGAFKGAAGPSEAAALRIVYTAQTAEDAPFSLADELKAQLRQIGLNHRRIALSRVEGNGDVTTSIIDLTARVDGKPDSPALIPDRAIPVINQKISALETTINTTKATTGDRALFTGLTKIAFANVPTYILSSGLDLRDPVAFPKLNWTTAPQRIVDNIKNAGELPHLQGPVTFIVTPTAGAQEQLRAKQAAYRDDVWRTLMAAAGATSVTFIDAIRAGYASGPTSTPVPLSEVPDTPIVPAQKLDNPKQATCTVPTAFFVVNTPSLIDEGKTIAALRQCIESALAAGATFELDGWTSYEGPLNSQGKPAVDDPGNRALSVARVKTIAALLTQKLGVDSRLITAMRGHGNTAQPVPDPRSPDNRRVDITYTTK